jgi:hypothetical protein
VLDDTEPLALLFSIIVVALAGDTDADLLGEVPDAVGPDELVELGVDSHIGGSHELGHQFSDFRQSTGSFLLELNAVGQLVQVDSRIDRALVQSLLFFVLLAHLVLWWLLITNNNIPFIQY